MYFCGISCNFFFPVLILLIQALFIFSKNEFSVSLIFSILFISLSFISALSFVIFFFFPSANWVLLALLPLVALGIRLGCLFGIFLIYWGKIILLSSLLELFLLHRTDFGSSCFHFHLSLGFFVILSLVHWIFSSILFSLHVFLFF